MHGSSSSGRRRRVIALLSQQAAEAQAQLAASKSRVVQAHSAEEVPAGSVAATQRDSVQRGGVRPKEKAAAVNGETTSRPQRQASAAGPSRSVGHGPASPTLRTPSTNPPQRGEPQRPRAQSRPTPPPPSNRSTPEARERIRKLLDSSRTLRWVVAGDNLVRPDAERQQVKTLTHLLADVVHAEPPRKQDLVVDFTRFGQRLTPPYIDQVLETLFAEQADVLVLFCGNRDTAQGPQGFDVFEETLNQLLFRVSDYGCPVVMNTPPSLQPGPRTQREEDVAREVYREAMLSAALKHDALIVDHWAHWEWSTSTHGSLGAWLGTDATQRSDRGLTVICDLLEREFDAAREHRAAQPRGR